uniref:protein-tyrosine-phosphatase n=1 Tax=Romanomermis culicivorax TaxID=13658 RepID=A0A915JR80_ROMCU
DHTLVELADGTYINASHLHTKDAGRCYILTQGPLPHTAIHFWRMVWEQNVHCIIMLNRLIEGGSRKCCSYFPGQEIGSRVKSAGSIIALQEFRIKLLEEVHKPNYSIRSIELNNLKVKNFSLPKFYQILFLIKLNLSRNIRHYQYITWPDFGVPNKTSEFLEFLFDVRKNNLLNCAVNGP